jgi:hypothetical protein
MSRRTRARFACFITSCSLFLFSCGGVVDPPPFPTCTGPVTLTVSAGTTPTFSWTPDCALGRLVVEEGFAERWGTEAPGDNIYRSPITYGIRPPGSTEEEPAAPLRAGSTYKVTVFRWVSYAPVESLQVLGQVQFTP